MMGSLELGPDADVSQLEPLLTLENIEQLEATFVAKVQVSSPGTGQRYSAHWLWPSYMYSQMSVSGLPSYILSPLTSSPRQV
jgi:hypothetical protein